MEKNPENIIGILHVRKLIGLKLTDPKSLISLHIVKNPGLYQCN